ncbi:allophanate hydrolase subunit 1 [Agrobacterium sp. NPDC090283]|uniref:5-oxoprolinase subunit B family protein n=1 Tax=Agrobacterium sp. NPDC090283 TaxID=3363920 RepID=UPI00383BDA62
MVLRSETAIEPRYRIGGDEYILVEFAESMSLEANLRAKEAAALVEASKVPGILEVCPAHVSYLVRYEPETIAPAKLINALKSITKEALTSELRPFRTRLIDMPVLFDDPWTHEVLMKYRDRVQEPTMTDAEYLASVNGLSSTAALFERLCEMPHISTTIGFAPGNIWTFQMTEKDKQIQAPKYLRPRNETPDRAFALGGAFTAVYPTRSAGGYPIIGRAAPPIYDPSRPIPDLAETGWLVRLGDIFRVRSILRDEYDRIQEEVAEGTYEYRKLDIEFDPNAFFATPKPYIRDLVMPLVEGDSK